MAVFLLIVGLLGLGGIKTLKAGGEEGVLGGPAPDYFGKNTSDLSISLALLSGEASISRGGSDPIVRSDYFTETAILDAAIIPDRNEARGITSPTDLDALRQKDYFAKPAQGYNFGKAHNNNAVDIANSCGSPVFASAEGLVVPDKNYPDGTTGWNGGYGSFVLIEHPSGVKTRYAHLEKVIAEIGDFVKSGQKIGLMGSTGNVHGVTGCHLHFEVLGAANPFIK